MLMMGDVLSIYVLSYMLAVTLYNMYVCMLVF